PVVLENQEWGSFMQSVVGLQYDVARRSWIGDYLDPNTFLACFSSTDGNNRTGWKEPRYDALLAAAAAELDPVRRMKLLSEAEGLLLDQCPVIPIYHYSSNELVKPYVHGIYPTPLDIHPIDAVTIDRDWRSHATQVAGDAATPR
ncbi:MAG TPA: hypothetical protein VLV15_15460, partial [Dongiaceae bacterium]|nr:hypothetical protein [Dongiaceae bacterium]